MSGELILNQDYGDLAKLAASDFACILDDNLWRLCAHSELCKRKKLQIIAKMQQKTCCDAHFRNLRFTRTNFARFPYEGDFDVVIGDDASTDRSCEIIEQVLHSPPRMRITTR